MPLSTVAVTLKAYYSGVCKVLSDDLHHCLVLCHSFLHVCINLILELVQLVCNNCVKQEH